jgi:hypothetical protein
VQFSMLCQGELVLRTRLAIGPPPTEEDFARSVDDAVEVFLRAYRAGPPSERRRAALTGRAPQRRRSR